MIYGERVRLRGIERSDIPAFLRWFNDPEVRQYLKMNAPLSLVQEERWFETRTAEIGSSNQIFGVEIPDGDGWRLIGNVGVERVDWQNSSAEVGIVIGEKDCWGQGFGTDAMHTLVRYLLREMNLHRVTLDVYDFNPRAMRCYEKVGFQHEGTKRQALFRNGQYHDVHLMGILRSEFKD